MNRNLKAFTLEDLEKEIAERRERKEVKESIQPLAFREYDYEQFVREMKMLVNQKIEGSGCGGEYCIYEAAVRFVFGDTGLEKIKSLE